MPPVEGSLATDRNGTRHKLSRPQSRTEEIGYDLDNMGVGLHNAEDSAER
jgi:hypothetical protein